MFDLPGKPRMGDACNGCGICCLATPCILAIEHADAVEGAPCPMLTWRDGRSWCGFVLFADEPLSSQIREALGDGSCDAGPEDGSDEGVGLNALEFLATRPDLA